MLSDVIWFIYFLIVAVMVLVIAAIVIVTLLSGRRGSTRAVITDSYRKTRRHHRVHRGSHEVVHYEAHFTYTVNGATYRSYGTVSFLSRLTGKTMVIYPPENPADCRTSRQAGFDIVIILSFIILLMTAGVFVLYFKGII